MPDLNQTTSLLIKDLKSAESFNQQKSTETIKTTRTASSLASWYEKARNAVEFRDEHLVRTAAIERIVKRRLFLNQESDKVAKNLIKELSWAKYFINNSIEASKIPLLSAILNKYRDAIKNLDQGYFEILVGLCSCEIEELLSFNPVNQILINYVSSSIMHRVEFDEDNLQTKSIQVYIATERTFAKNSEDLITYKLLKVLLPKWDDSKLLVKSLETINNHLNYPKKDILKIKISQMMPPFNLLREIILSPKDFTKIITSKEEFRKKALNVLEEKYLETKDKVLRASKRSIIYIFLTKMILAILIEIPFEIILSKINYTVLTINILFPPTLMFLFNSGVKLPDSKNTKNILEKLDEYLYLDEKNIIPTHIEINKQNNKLDKIFFYLFVATSTFIVLGILWFLNLLKFSLISQFIFLFFLSVVSFFAFRVREISSEFIIKDTYGESFLDTLLDYIFLPIIKVGQFLSNQISKLNILSFIFDFIIEAPLKSFLEILEDWLHFVRVKKEEILS